MKKIRVTICNGDVIRELEVPLNKFSHSTEREKKDILYTVRCRLPFDSFKRTDYIKRDFKFKVRNVKKKNKRA